MNNYRLIKVYALIMGIFMLIAGAYNIMPSLLFILSGNWNVIYNIMSNQYPEQIYNVYTYALCVIAFDVQNLLWFFCGISMIRTAFKPSHIDIFKVIFACTLIVSIFGISYECWVIKQQIKISVVIVRNFWYIAAALLFYRNSKLKKLN